MEYITISNLFNIDFFTAESNTSINIYNYFSYISSFKFDKDNSLKSNKISSDPPNLINKTWNRS